MTDPRILECAKAIREVIILEFPQIEHLLSDMSEEHIARACILKWLEHGSTDEMKVMGDIADSGAAGSGCVSPDCSGGLDHVYRAMCAQAAKEIAE